MHPVLPRTCGVLGILGAALLASPEASSACSVRPLSGLWAERVTYLLGTALSDTLRAGGGSAPFVSESPVWGQAVRLEGVSGSAEAQIRHALESGTDAVLIPWGYRPDCSTAPWEGSARWAEPGVRGVYWAVLREREQWVDGRPTFDVARAWGQPYPHGELLRHSFEGGYSPDRALTPDQLFSLLEHLPTEEQAAVEGYRAFQPLEAWLARHRELVDRLPVREVLRGARSAADSARVGGADPPAAGTFRAPVELPLDSAPTTLFLRISTGSGSCWNRRGSDPAPGPAAMLRPGWSDG